MAFALDYFRSLSLSKLHLAIALAGDYCAAKLGTTV